MSISFAVLAQAVQRLHSVLRVHAQHYRMFERIVLQVNDIDNLVDDRWTVWKHRSGVVSGRTCARSVRSPISRVRTSRPSTSRTSVSHWGRRFESVRDDVFDLMEQDRRRSSGPWFVGQSVEAFVDEPRTLVPRSVEIFESEVTVTATWGGWLGE